MKTTQNVLKYLFIAFFLSCNSNENFKENDATTLETLHSRNEYDKYCYESFWENIDTLYLEKVTIFKNSLMCYNKLPLLFFKMKNLRIVELDTETKFDTLTSEIANLKELEILLITKSKLKYLPKEIGQLKKLRRLSIAWGGQLTDIPIEIGNLSNLEELDLFRNNLTTLPKEIYKLKNLKQLKLGENNFSTLEKKRIVTLLPNCKIYFDFIK